MNLKFILTTAVFLYTNLFYTQNNCHCSEALDKLIIKIENEYPGFEQKTKNKVVYESFKKQLSGEAGSKEPENCIEVLRKYTSFFRDGHIWINSSIAKKEQLTGNTDFVKIDPVKFQKSIKSKATGLEGVWKSKFLETGNIIYDIGITKNNNSEYTGFIITSGSKFWKPQEVKFRLFSSGKYEYYSIDKSLRTGTYEVYQDNILYLKEARVFFVKEVPENKLSEEQVKMKVGELRGFDIKPVTDKTTIIKLPSFDYPYVEIIENLINNNRSLLENSKNLIVDIRGNSGGTDTAYYNLLPYIMTGAIRKMGVEYLSTKTLVDGLTGYIESVKNKEDRKEEIEMLNKQIALLKNNMGKFVNLSGNLFSVNKIETSGKGPEHIVVLVDKRVGSAAENFVMATRQSKKVKIAGTVSSGGLDYAAARFFDFGCPEYQLQLPTFRSLRLPDYPVDNIGLQPDLYLDKNIEDWVQYITEYLEN
ncbi:S41 family peptidase [Elizabethkingia meningoseptica]|uniref:S41 family peptidase n=1 Tax=Elizabethkingia meningoseptica TaxID=238 RepID=UPI0023AF10A4|nr:S41 family peptidase [Elizabethkingia meningoseptica]